MYRFDENLTCSIFVIAWHCSRKARPFESHLCLFFRMHILIVDYIFKDVLFQKMSAQIIQFPTIKLRFILDAQCEENGTYLHFTQIFYNRKIGHFYSFKWSLVKLTVRLENKGYCWKSQLFHCICAVNSKNEKDLLSNISYVLGSSIGYVIILIVNREPHHTHYRPPIWWLGRERQKVFKPIRAGWPDRAVAL